MYPAIWTRSQRGQLSADYESAAFPGNTFIFLQKRKTQQCSYFRCAHCAKAMKLRARRNAHKLTVPIVRATLEEGFLDDPDNPLHRHFCIDEDGVDTSTYAAKARYIYNKVKLELLDTPMTPRQAWLQMEAEVIANFPEPETQREIIRRLPSDKSAKRSFARRSSIGRRNLAGELANLTGFGLEEEMYFLLDAEEADEDGFIGAIEPGDPALNDPRNVPLELLKPYGQRPSWVCAPGRENLANFFLIYRDCRPHCPPFMVFSDMMGVNLLHKCADIVCDGNSNFYPCGFAQLYTFHAVHPSIPDEAHLCAFALLPNTAPSTYVKLFDVLSERLLAEYGDHGAVKNWHFDNQFAAINGCRAIFKEDVVEGSEQRTANFAQLWHDHLSGLFAGDHPNLVRFIRIMRQELARASIQAERIFQPPPPVLAVNLDNIEAMNRMSSCKEEGEGDGQALLWPGHLYAGPRTVNFTGRRGRPPKMQSSHFGNPPRLFPCHPQKRRIQPGQGIPGGMKQAKQEPEQQNPPPPPPGEGGGGRAHGLAEEEGEEEMQPVDVRIEETEGREGSRRVRDYPSTAMAIGTNKAGMK